MEQKVDAFDPAMVSIVIAATPQDVWSALTTASGLAPWLGEGATIEPRHGGAVSAPDPVGGRPRRGRVDLIEDDHRLGLIWWPVTNPAERSTVVISLEPIETGQSTDGASGPLTRVTVTESVPESVARRATTDRSIEATAAESTVAESTVAAGAWSWRLALLLIACQLVVSGVARTAMI